MCVAMQEQVHVGRWHRGRNMHELDPEAFLLKIKDQRPFLFPVAIATYHPQRFAQGLEFDKDHRIANITQMPDGVGLHQARG